MGITSVHFSDAELACRHCRVNGCQQSLVDALEAFRVEVGQPVIVDDAYRCPEHNKAVGGVRQSQHVQGLAADIRVEGMTADSLERIARRIPAIRGIGRDPHANYLHIDTRTVKAQWCYGPDGKQCAYYPPPPIAS